MSDEEYCDKCGGVGSWILIVPEHTTPAGIKFEETTEEYECDKCDGTGLVYE